MTPPKIIFLDFDGPLIPKKAKWLTPRQGRAQMDPCAVSLIQKLIEIDFTVQFVISSNHSLSGLDHCKSLLQVNDLPWIVHKDWCTKITQTSLRAEQIREWLDDHPEVVDWVAIDDIPLNAKLVPNFAQCDEHEGFSYRNFLECKLHLKIRTPMETYEGQLAEINWFKFREVSRTTRLNDLTAFDLIKCADQTFSKKYYDQNEDSE